MVQHLHQAMQTISISFIPLFGNLGRTPPDPVHIRLFCSGQYGFECLPSRDTLVNAVVCVHPSQRIIGETPLAGIEAVALVDEDCCISLTSLFLSVEDSLPSVAVACPLVQDKNPREVVNIDDSLKQFARQEAECHAGTLPAHAGR